MKIKIPDMKDFVHISLNCPIPSLQGIYLLLIGSKIEYIGQTKNLRIRISTHKSNGVIKITPEIDGLKFLEVKQREKRLFYEQCYFYRLFKRQRNKLKYSRYIKREYDDESDFFSTMPDEEFKEIPPEKQEGFAF